METSPSPLSSRPKRTRISCYAAPDKAACAPFFKERRIKFANATNFNRKSGAAQRRDLCVDAPSWRCFSTELPWACGPPKVRKTPQSGNRSLWNRRPSLCHPERSRGICGSADLSWKCFSTVAQWRDLRFLFCSLGGQNQMGNLSNAS